MMHGAVITGCFKNVAVAHLWSLVITVGNVYGIDLKIQE
jgi:hypothetical protein